ncbi:hypothetical protein DEU56DRAFT_394576 [Suillus clintonianus]|uniref:uncharacterized protein n=1 Tax=Suillus clintonianus TaxID=1904413 RepID=UPI001B87E2BA|nr:uncharacterized protein DEU56DRAFT_394576 [Suillus clintonianus]KAG2135504.1 hypothetical protein DEU56DRAFT_394576 [Suillus clintonianus]
MHRALMSLSIGDSDKPSFSPFVPPPIQRLSLPPSVSLSCANKSTSPSPPSSSSTPGLSPPPRACPKKLKAPTKSLTSSSPVPGPSTSNPSAIFPYLHRLEIRDDMASRRQQRPLLVLKLSSPSFLDSVATDLVAETPLYSVETVGSSTTVWRSDPWGASVKIADICWPKELPLKGKGRDTHGALIQMGDPRWKDTDSYLKYASLGNSRKFSLPNHPHVLKWKRTGRTYQCTTSSCKGPIASLDTLQDDENTPRLKVFETLGPVHQSVPQVEHAGISLSLLDNLFVTALLLVTEADDWMTLRHNPNSLDTPATDTVSLPKSTSAPASARQWRKIMYGEPLYPSLKTPAVDTRCNEDADVLDISSAAPPPTSVNQWRKIVYGEPLYPSLRPHSADGLDLPPRPGTAWDTASISSESVCYPATPCSAPSSGFYTSTFFDESDRSVPRINTSARYSAPLSLSPATVSPIPASDCMALSSQPSPSPRAGTRRELPAPPSSWHPPPGSQPWLHRSRSSPRLSSIPTARNRLVTEDGVLASPTPLDGDTDGVGDTPQSRSRALSSGSVVRRRLPTVPSNPASPASSPPARTKRLPTLARTLPPTPISIPRSPSTGHRYTHSSNIISQTPISETMPTRPSTAQQPRTRNRPEKDPDEVLGWVRNVTRAHHHRRALDCEELEGRHGVLEEAPPPAYNAIDFSKPPHSRALPNPS